MENLPQQQALEGPLAAAPSPAPRKPPVIRMDKSRDFSTVHGDILPGDPDEHLRFVQDGLPFDSHGKLLINHHTIEKEERLQKKVEKLLLQAMKRQAANPGDADPEDRDEIEEDFDETFAEDDDDGVAPINLVDWAAGTAQYPWQDITNAIASRYAKRVMNKKGAIELLIEERVVSAGALSKAHRRLLQD
jgi:hypothetical protein